jgi:hypothetical protein
MRPKRTPTVARSPTTSRRLESLDKRRLALEAEVDEKTLRRFLRGEEVRDASRRRIVRTAKALRLELPRTPSRQGSAS